MFYYLSSFSLSDFHEIINIHSLHKFALLMKTKMYKEFRRNRNCSFTVQKAINAIVSQLAQKLLFSCCDTTNLNKSFKKYSLKVSYLFINVFAPENLLQLKLFPVFAEKKKLQLFTSETQTEKRQAASPSNRQSLCACQSCQ